MQSQIIRNLLCGAAVSSMLAVSLLPTNAADVTSEEPPMPDAVMAEPAPIYGWNGAYAGVTAGYGFGKAQTPTGNPDIDGFRGSGFVGYNYQTGPMVLGLETEGGYGAVKGSAGGVNVKGGLDGSLRARMGITPTDNLLVYGTAGGAIADVKLSDAAGKDNQSMLGWTAGAGVDAMLTENVFGRAEYRYTDYGSKTFNTGSGAQKVDVTDNRVQFGLGLKF